MNIPGRRIASICAMVFLLLSMPPIDARSAPPGDPRVSFRGVDRKDSALSETHPVEIGAFLGVSPPTSAAVNAFEGLAGRDIHSVMWYQGWDKTGQPSFPCKDLIPVQFHDGFRANLTFHLTWEPWVKLADIASGGYDAYLARYAAEVKQCGLKTLLRFAHEMIQDDRYDNCLGQTGCPEWYPWQDQPADYVAAFRHVHEVFRSAGATNVEFVWCPNNDNLPGQRDILAKYYPGAQYVDWLCIDGYKKNGSDWTSGWFDDIFYNTYHTLVDNQAIFGEKPVMIGEMAACPGPVKPAWITNAFDNLKSDRYSKIGAFYWFQVNNEEEKEKGCNWLVNSAPDSLAAFQAAIQDNHFTSHARLFPFYLPVAWKSP